MSIGPTLKHPPSVGALTLEKGTAADGRFMDLKGGNLLWPALTPRREAYPALEQSLDCEVLVVGAGITGAMAAWHLAKAGADVMVVDRRPPVTGSTPGSTALLQYEIDKPLVELRTLVGRAAADRAYRRCDKALDDLAALVARLDDPSDLAARTSLYLAGRGDSGDLFRAESVARQEIGIAAKLLSPVDLQREFGITGRAGAILSAHALEADPYRLTLSLLRGAARVGARIFGQTQVMLELAAPGEVRLLANDRHVIRARQVVFAMGYETPAQFSVRDLCQLKSTYAIATAPIDPAQLWPARSLVWEHADPYFYARTTADGRIVAGGEDVDLVDPEQRDALIPAKSRTLVAKLKSLFPGLPIEPAFRWAGTFAETEDGLPYIGATPTLPGCQFALGYGGNGITFSLIAAQIITSAISGTVDPDAEIFSFDRVNWRR